MAATNVRHGCAGRFEELGGREPGIPAVTIAAARATAASIDRGIRMVYLRWVGDPSKTLLPIAQYDFRHWRARRGPQSAIAELAVDYAVPDIQEHIVRVERCQHQHPKEILSERRGDRPGEAAGASGDTVTIGRTVRVFDVGSGKLHIWTVVRASEADAASGKLSADSPIARALLGRKPGEIVTAETPRGPRQLEIKELST